MEKIEFIQPQPGIEDWRVKSNGRFIGRVWRNGDDYLAYVTCEQSAPTRVAAFKAAKKQILELEQRGQEGRIINAAVIEAVAATDATDAVAFLRTDTPAGQDRLRRAEVGEKFLKGRKVNSGGPIRAAIARLLKKDPALKNQELWHAVKARPPKGWTACDNRQGEYFEGPRAADNMGKPRFLNVCSEERKKLK